MSDKKESVFSRRAFLGLAGTTAGIATLATIGLGEEKRSKGPQLIQKLLDKKRMKQKC